jgi:glucose/arabinose dehydrogenase
MWRYTLWLPVLLLALPAVADSPVLSGADAYGNWHDDAPGVVRHLTVASMPPPNETRSASNMPSVVPQPAGGTLHVPSGFAVAPFASGLEGPRTLRVAPNGDVFVAESIAGRIRILRSAPGATTRPQSYEFSAGLDYPFGMVFWPPGPTPRFLYIAESSRIVRFPYQTGDVRASGAAQVVVPHLPIGGHWTRDVVFSPDGKTMYIAIGSATNAGVQLTKTDTTWLRSWDAEHGVGAGWDEEQDRADVIAFDPDGGNRRTFATGLRNCSAEAMAPAGGALWCAVNERDGLGDNLPPDYVTHVQQGAFYGWPWFYIGDHQDPRLKGLRSDLADHVAIPDVLIQPHSAPLGITFYDGAQFPPEYRGDAFVTLHGSWNRAKRTGYKVVRLHFAGGRPTGNYEDFLTGFVASDEAVWGRPVGVAVARDGSLLVSDDGNGTIWRIAWQGQR